MPVFDQDAALVRRVGLARSATGQSRRVANFLLARRNAGDRGGCDGTDLRMVDRAMADDILTAARLVSIRHEDPTADGYGPQVEQLVADGRPRLVERPEAGRP